MFRGLGFFLLGPCVSFSASTLRRHLGLGFRGEGSRVLGFIGFRGLGFRVHRFWVLRA